MYLWDGPSLFALDSDQLMALIDIRAVISKQQMSLFCKISLIKAERLDFTFIYFDDLLSC